MTGYVGDIEEITLQNEDFRRVLHTGTHAQLVAMSLLPGEEIGTETHPHTDQFFRIERGTIKIEMSGESHILTDGMVAVVPAGLSHNLVNIGTVTAKLYTLYSPPNHPANTIQKTKAEAELAERSHQT